MTQVVMGKTRDAWIVIIASVLKCQFGTASYLFDAIVATEKFGTLAWYEQEFELKEKKMTRQEAIEVVQKHLDPNNEVGNNIVNALEALGLLKFEEEKPKISNNQMLAVADALRAECLKVFGSDWNYRYAKDFAKVAIETWEKVKDCP